MFTSYLLLWQKWSFCIQYVHFYTSYFGKNTEQCFKMEFFSFFLGSPKFYLDGPRVCVCDPWPKNLHNLSWWHMPGQFGAQIFLLQKHIYILKNDLFFKPVINIHIFSRDGIWFSCFVKSCSIWKKMKSQNLKF